MDSNQTYRVSGGKLAAAIIMAVLAGLSYPLVTMLQIGLMLPVMLLSGAFMVFLYCFAGRMPALLFMVVNFSSTTVMFGAIPMWMSLLAGTAPAMICMRRIAEKKPFFKQMEVAICAYIGGLLAAIMLGYAAFGGNMIGQMMTLMKRQAENLPDEYYATMLEMMGGTSPLSTLLGFDKLSISLYRKQMVAALDMLDKIYPVVLPGNLITGAALGGVVSVAWGNWLLARRGLASNESYTGMKYWFLPGSVSIGLLSMWIVSYIIAGTGYGGAEPVYSAVYGLVMLAFEIQALCAMDRFMYRKGMANGVRHGLMALALISAQLSQWCSIALFALGTASALFGSNGALRRPPRRYDDNNADQDDSQL